MRGLISGAQFSVYPSEWYENCPFSVMESISLGTPVLGADIGGIPELLENGAGMLFRTGDTEDLRDKISRMWDDPHKCVEMSKNVNESEFYTLEKYTEIYLRLLKC